MGDSMKTIYVCGPTVYDKVHIGNMRPIISYDLLTRGYRYLNNEVMFIHNITDIDDKIIAKAKRENKTETEISTQYKEHYFSLFEKLNIIKPTHMPTVTENMDEIIRFVSLLIEKDCAYSIDGDVYFSVDKVKDYGKVSNQNVANLLSEDSNKKKRSQLDFALWKKTTDGIKFDSPWGMGRPGWHTECSAFIGKYLKGESLDIHGGGIDLIFPHHENENAQYIAAYDKDITKKWDHIGHLFYHGEKMSKSIGNLINSDDFISLHGPDTLRMIFLQSNPKSPIDIHIDSINNAKELIEKYSKIFIAAQLKNDSNIADESTLKNIALELTNWNFSTAMKIVNDEVKRFNKTKENNSTIIEIYKLLGFSFSKRVVSEDEKNLYNEWMLARENKNFARADVLREELKKTGII